MNELNVCTVRQLLICRADWLVISHVSFSRSLIGYHLVLCIGICSKLCG